MQLKFKMLTLRQVVSQIRSEDWFVTIDLKDAYFHVSIFPTHRKFLLPFGLALSPRTFRKCVDAALAPLRLQGIRILNYIDAVCFFPRSLCSREFWRECTGTRSVYFGSTVLAGPSMVLGPDFSPRRLSMGDSHQGELFSQAGVYHPRQDMWKLWVWPLRVHNRGCWDILQSIAPSTRKLYVLKWKLFTFNCPIGTVLDFLLAPLSAGLTHSSLVYVCNLSSSRERDAASRSHTYGNGPAVYRLIIKSNSVQFIFWLCQQMIGDSWQFFTDSSKPKEVENIIQMSTENQKSPKEGM